MFSFIKKIKVFFISGIFLVLNGEYGVFVIEKVQNFVLNYRCILLVDSEKVKKF